MDALQIGQLQQYRMECKWIQQRKEKTKEIKGEMENKKNGCYLSLLGYGERRRTQAQILLCIFSCRLFWRRFRILTFLLFIDDTDVVQRGSVTPSPTLIKWKETKNVQKLETHLDATRDGVVYYCWSLRFHLKCVLNC